MTTLPDRPATALLIVDVQVGVVAGAPFRDAVVANINRLADQARAAGVAVIWVQHQSEDLAPASAAWQFAPELAPAPDEPLIAKAYGDAFEETTLEAVLAERGIGRLVITGAESDACIRSTLHGALVRGYDAILVSDAHTTGDKTQWGAPAPEAVIAHTNLYWTYQQAPGRTAGTVATEAVDFGGTTHSG